MSAYRRELPVHDRPLVWGERMKRKTMPMVSLLLLIVAALLAGCASGGARGAYRAAESAAERELWDQAVLGYAKASALEPGDTRYKVALARAKLRASAEHFDRGKKYLTSGQLEMALHELQEAVILDPSNQYAITELEKANDLMSKKLKGPSDMERAQREAQRRAADLGPPRLVPSSIAPLVLRFPDSTVNDVYEAIAKGSGINIIYDEKVDLKKKLSVELANVTFEKAMDIIMLQTKHFYKVLDSHTIIIADDNRQKRTEYEDNVIRTFYLSNAETKDVQTLLRSLLESRRIAENADLNAITIKDTPEKIKVAERIIRANDKAKGEVVVDMELLEINRSDTRRLGFDLTTKAISLVFTGGTSSGGSGGGTGGSTNNSLPLNLLERLKSQSAWSLGPIPSITFDFLKTDTNAKSISKPSVRILEGENGKITIGDRVPIPATTFNQSQTIGGNIVPITSFQYQNVGIIVDIKPRVHHNKEITLELKIEVSALSGTVEGTGGVSQPIIGTRSVETTIRLRDGETNILAGLIKEDEQESLSGIPGLSDIPILRRLFGRTGQTESTTDIVLSITPHIIRTPNIEPIDLVPLWVGTEEQIQLRGVARSALGESPFASNLADWEGVDQQLNGDTPSDPSGKTPQVKVRTDDRRGAKPAAEEPPRQRQPRKMDGEASEPPPPPPAARRDAKPDARVGGETDAAGIDEGLTGDEPTLEDEEGDEPAEEANPQPVLPAMVRLSPSRQQMQAGESLGVDVMIQSATNVGQVNFQLRYNPEILRFAPPGEAGDFMTQGGAAPDVQIVEAGGGGTVVVSINRPAGMSGAEGGGRLVRLNFVALKAGSAGFQFATAAVRDPQANALPAGLRVTNVDVLP
jgi:general secretion pathway protein D